MGNVIDIVLAVSFGVAIIRGWHIGLVQKLAHLIALMVASGISHLAGNALKETVAKEILLPALEKGSKETIDGIPYAREGLSYGAGTLAYYLIFAVVFVVVMLVLNQLIRGLKIVDYIPVVGLLNKVGGAFVGFLTEFVVLYILFYVFFHLIPGTVWESIGLTDQMIDQTYLLKVFVKK